MVHGWRPTSVVVQPAITAMKPRQTVNWQALRYQPVSSSRLRHSKNNPQATIASINSAMPTMMRKAK